MKLLPITWPVVLLAAIICAAFAGMYHAFDLPFWIVAYALASAAILAAVSHAMRIESRRVALPTPFEHGRCNGRLARRNLLTGVVEFSYVDHSQLRWSAFHHTYWRLFIPAPSARGETIRAPARLPAAPLESVRTN
jgi:hypothetical protein